MNNDDSSFAKCGCYALLFVFNVLLGSWSVNYLLVFFGSHAIPFIGSALIGLIAGQFTVPIAIVCAVLRWFHVL